MRSRPLRDLTRSAIWTDWGRWAWPAVLACAAVAVGVLAGVRPELAILCALGLAFVLMVFVDLTSGLVVFTFLTFIELLPGADSAAFGFTKIAGLLLAISWLAHLATRTDTRSDPFHAHPMIGATLVLFVVWAGLSVTWAEDSANALDATYRLGLNAILFLIVFTTVREPSDAIRVVWAFVIGATTAAALGIATSGGTTPYGEAARLAGDVDNANQLASSLVASLALALGLAFISRNRPALRAGALALAAFSMLGVLLTVSRSGLVSLGVAAVAAIVLSGRWRPQIFAVSVLAAVAALGYFAVLAPPAARERITTFEGGTGREDIWRVAWRMAEDKPVNGVGAGNFENASIHYLLVPGTLRRSDFIVDTQKNAHSALVSLIIALIACALKAIRQFERDGNLQMEILSRTYLVAVFGLLASLFFASDEYRKQLWLLLSLAPCLLAIAGAHPKRDSDS